jgi:hypothetical protein
LINTTVELFAEPDYPTVEQVLKSVDTLHFGASLQSPDLTAVWGYRTLLVRDFGSVAEYRDAVLSLPELVLGGG